MSTNNNEAGLKLLGINLGKRKAASRNLSRLMFRRHAAIAFVQEPNTAHFRRFSGVTSFGTNLKIINNSHGPHTRAVIVASSDLNIVELPHSSNKDPLPQTTYTSKPGMEVRLRIIH